MGFTHGQLKEILQTTKKLKALLALGEIELPVLDTVISRASLLSKHEPKILWDVE